MRRLPAEAQSAKEGNLNYVYILQSLSRPEEFYTGLCADVQQRSAAHNAVQSPHTSKFKPWRVLSVHYFADAPPRSNAISKVDLDAHSRRNDCAFAPKPSQKMGRSR